MLYLMMLKRFLKEHDVGVIIFSDEYVYDLYVPSMQDRQK